MLDVFATLDTGTEIDQYTVTLEAGKTYFLFVDGDFTDREPSAVTLNDPVLWLRTGADVQIVYNDDGGGGYDSLIVYTPTVTDVYKVDVGAFSGNSPGTYRLIVSEEDFSNRLGNVAPVGQVEAGGHQAGALNYGPDHGLGGDIDFLQMRVLGGLRYQLEVIGLTRADATQGSAALHLTNSNLGGFSLDATSGTTIILKTVAASVYTLQISDADQGPGGSYDVVLSRGRATIGDDSVIGSTFADAVDGLGGDDVLRLGLGNDDADGGLGNDTLIGGQENDMLAGASGIDWLYGGFGDDTLVGGSGSDRLKGRDGADVFKFNTTGESSFAAFDVILATTGGAGFDGAGQMGGDLIDLSAIDGDSTADGLQHLIFDGNQGLGHVWMETRGNGAAIMAQTDADGPNFRLVIAEGASLVGLLNAGDFVL